MKHYKEGAPNSTQLNKFLLKDSRSCFSLIELKQRSTKGHVPT